MINLFCGVCNAFCALTMWHQVIIATACVFIAAGIVWLILWGLCALLYKLAESVGVSLDADYEPYDADWMDFDAWETGR